MTRWITYGLAVVCSVAALFVPWSHFGDIEFGLTDFPGWYVYVAGAVVLHAATYWNHAAAVAGGAVALGTAVVLMLQYGNSEMLFPGGIVPAVFPMLGFGGQLAIVGVVLNAVLLSVKRAAPAEVAARPR